MHQLQAVCENTNLGQYHAAKQPQPTCSRLYMPFLLLLYKFTLLLFSCILPYLLFMSDTIIIKKGGCVQHLQGVPKV